MSGNKMFHRPSSLKHVKIHTMYVKCLQTNITERRTTTFGFIRLKFLSYCLDIYCASRGYLNNRRKQINPLNSCPIRNSKKRSSCTHIRFPNKSSFCRHSRRPVYKRKLKITRVTAATNHTEYNNNNK